MLVTRSRLTPAYSKAVNYLSGALLLIHSIGFHFTRTIFCELALLKIKTASGSRIVKSVCVLSNYIARKAGNVFRLLVQNIP